MSATAMRLQKIDPSDYRRLDNNDECYYLGEYMAHGGFKASTTNSQIINLKMELSAAPIRLRYKDHAVIYWGDLLAASFKKDAAESITLIPAPPSKPVGHAEYDDRMIRVLSRVARIHPNIDVRPVIVTPRPRRKQHDGERMSHVELVASMAIDERFAAQSFRDRVFIVDDVFTQGGTFKAMQEVLRVQLNVRVRRGLFLAKTVWSEEYPFDEYDPTEGAF